jgi:S1-C subfamily serine protease
MKKLSLAALLVVAFAAFADDAARPGWLGFGFTHHTQEKEQWLVVRGVLPNSPAAAAGIREQDVVVAIDGKPVQFKDSLALLELLATVRPGQRVRFTILRERRKSVRVVTAAPMTAEQHERWKANLEMARRAARR